MIGRKPFHVSDISWSYRIRGRVARIQMKTEAITKVVDGKRIGEMGGMGDVRNSEVVRSLMNRIIIYSAMKMSANDPALYSMLNPDTSSDSPSAKSNGVRLVSARAEMSHMGAKGRVGRAFGIEVVVRKDVRSKERRRRRGDSIIRAILTSYEIVCATPRMAPRRAYLEFENQPAPRVV